MSNDRCKTCGKDIIVQIRKGTGYCSQNCEELSHNTTRAEDDYTHHPD